MPTPDTRWCQTRNERHNPHVWKGPGYKYLCLGQNKGLARATAKDHGTLVEGQFLYFGDGDVPAGRWRTPNVLRHADGSLTVVRVSDEVEITSFGRARKFWAAPVPADETPEPDPAKVEEISGEIRTFLADAQAWGQQATVVKDEAPSLGAGPFERFLTDIPPKRWEYVELPTFDRARLAEDYPAPTDDLPAILDPQKLVEARDAWVSARTERSIQRGVHRRTARAMAVHDWPPFEEAVQPTLREGRFILAIKITREWTGLGLKESRDLMATYREAYGYRDGVRPDGLPAFTQIVDDQEGAIGYPRRVVNRGCIAGELALAQNRADLLGRRQTVLGYDAPEVGGRMSGVIGVALPIGLTAI